jgi:hypothetical protein
MTNSFALTIMAVAFITVRRSSFGSSSMVCLHHASWAASPTNNIEQSGRQRQRCNHEEVHVLHARHCYWRLPADTERTLGRTNDDRSTAHGGLRIADVVTVASGRQPTMKTSRRRKATGNTRAAATMESSKLVVPLTERSLYICTNLSATTLATAMKTTRQQQEDEQARC